ncbi:MAG TPA: enoyl-CoA hydratase [Ktedonobacteraceae bacterium]|jgi:enoyl-CoA hydratase/carnithine racemase|nr:enoyl-CoA hydratase [Ktedonobacteraceae bacterium]
MSDQDKGTSDERGTVLLAQEGAVAVVTLSRPNALNALTWKMYEELEAHLTYLATAEHIRAIIIRGDGERALAAGTDISQFQGFSGVDGIAYEQRMDAIIDRLATMPQPVLAAIHGYAVGAGLIIATASDLRYATRAARFGAPMARTLGNCLSLKNYRRLAQALGAMRSKELLFTSRLLSAEEALQCGFLTAILDEEQLFAEVFEIAKRISTLAPLTIWASKEAFKRIEHEREGDEAAFADVLARVYGSADFAEGVQAYVEKRRPNWRGESQGK